MLRGASRGKHISTNSGTTTKNSGTTTKLVELTDAELDHVAGGGPISKVYNAVREAIHIAVRVAEVLVDASRGK